MHWVASSNGPCDVRVRVKFNLTEVKYRGKKAGMKETNSFFLTQALVEAVSLSVSSFSAGQGEMKLQEGYPPHPSHSPRLVLSGLPSRYKP